MIHSRQTLVAGAVAAFILSACGGGSGPVSSSGGKAVDGYISNALVVCDADNNGALTAGEATTVTNSTGDFTFSPACYSPIVVTGGTNIDTGLPFKGKLLAPSGSKVATPLTTLVASGLSLSQVAAAFGLPATLDVTTADPMQNPLLLKQTLAAQQIIQQTADTLASLAQNTSAQSVQSLYLQVASAVSSTLVSSGTPLVSAAGAVSQTLVSSAVQKSVTNASTTVPVLATVSPVSLSELVSGSIASQAQVLAQSSAANLTTNAAALQSSIVIANTASQLAPLLATSVAGSVDLTAAGTALQQLSDTDSSNNTAASTAISSAVATQNTAAGTSVVVDTNTLAAPSNTLGILNDSVVLNGATYTLSQFISGVQLESAPSALDTISFDYVLNGTPIPANAQGNKTITVGLGLEMSDTGTGKRLLQLILDQVVLTVNGSNQLTASVPAGAKVYAYGRTSSGATANLTLSNLTADDLVAASSTQFSFRVGKILSKFDTEVAGLSAGNPVKAVFANLPNAKGTFNVKASISNVNVQAQTSTTAVKGVTISVTDSTIAPLVGLGVQGVVTTAP